MTGSLTRERPSFARALLIGVFVTLPLATGPHEVLLALATGVAVLSHRRLAFFDDPWARPVIALAVVWTAASAASANFREGIGHVWPLFPLLVVPALREGNVDAVERAGIAAACLAAVWAVGQRAVGLGGTAGMSHHLTLAYALLPPLGVAVARRRKVASLLLAAGVLATGSAGASVALCVTILAALPRVGAIAAATTAGAAATVAGLWFADREELGQRAVLWTGGLWVSATGPAGPGAYPAAAAPEYEALSPGFWFPNHAHDSGIQLLAVLGPAGLLAMLALVVLGLFRGATGAAAGLGGVLVGALTQDVFGDLEVSRACWAWLALLPSLPRVGSSGTSAPALDTK